MKRKFEKILKGSTSSNVKKHSLDSDEEDSDDYERNNFNNSDIEGGEDSGSDEDNKIRTTPFNMRQELEEGHFDKDGHYHWNKSRQIRDNWLDNIDNFQVQCVKKSKKENDTETCKDSESNLLFNTCIVYKQILEFLKPNESVQMALQRLGRNKPKLSTLKRLKLKKNNIEDQESILISKLTELANDILQKTGNMNIYQETYEEIKDKINNDALKNIDSKNDDVQ